MSRPPRRRVASLLLGVGALFPVSGGAHYDGTPMEAGDSVPPRHSYYWSTVTTQRDKDPIVACTQYCTVTQSKPFFDVWFDTGSKRWKCQCEAASPPGAPGTIHTSTNGGEVHCNYGEAFSSATGGSCSSGGPTNCMVKKGHFISFLGLTNPPGFNVPNDASANGTPFATLKNCSLKRVTSTGVGGCWNLTYSVTGSAKVDEDGLPLALDDGSTWPTGIPAVCDPDTEEEDPDGWSGSDPGGGGGSIIPTENADDIPDPTVEHTEDLEEEADSWLDALLDPETWEEGMFDGLGTLWDLWDVTGGSCAGSVDITFPSFGAHVPPTIQIDCAKTEQMRNALAILLNIAFFYWLINLALTPPPK